MINLYSSTGTSGRPFSHITKLAFWREKFSVCKNSVKTVSRQFFAFLIFLEFWNTRWLDRISNKMATEAPVKQYFTGIIKQVSGILLLIKLSVWIFWTNLPVSTSMKDLLFKGFVVYKTGTSKLICFTEPVLSLVILLLAPMLQDNFRNCAQLKNFCVT